MDALDELRRESARSGYGLRLGGGAGGETSCVPPEHALLVLGPPRSGKTSSIVVPNIVAACGPVISTSTKRDVLEATLKARSRVGECALFDPSGLISVRGLESVGWSPIMCAAAWDEAVRTTQSMVLAARPGDRGESRHWTERSEALMAPSFHAAALDGRDMAWVLGAIDRHHGTEVRTVLARYDADLALQTLESVLATEEREQSGIYSTAASLLSSYRSQRALDQASYRPVDFRRFVESGATIYVCCGTDEQRRSGPIVAGLLTSARVAAYAAASRGVLGYANGRPPLLLALDEVANIAPLHDLPSLVSEGGSQGVITLACLQDLSQAVQRWGPIAEGFLGLFNTKVIFPGVGDTRTLEAISRLAGEHEVASVSRSEGNRLPGVRGLLGLEQPARRTVTTRKERLLPLEAIARGLEGHVVCLDGARPSYVALRPYYRDPVLQVALRGPQLRPGREKEGVRRDLHR